MKNLEQLITEQKIRFIDHSKEPSIFSHSNNALASFAIDDAIATTVGNDLSPVTIRIWVHPNTVVLGIPDSRLPYLEKGLHMLQEQNYHAVIRNSGGLAVLLNEGVLNMSFIIPSNQEVSIHDGYDMMYQFIQELFTDYTNEVKAYEIKGSYCPGDYDLSMNGMKFAGISQRRVRNGIAIQIYLDIEGSSYERASIVRDFYTISKQEETTKYEYPEVNPNVMGSINQLLGTNFTVDEVILKIKQAFIKKGITISSNSLLHEEKELFLKRLEQMEKRNQKIKLFNPK